MLVEYEHIHPGWVIRWILSVIILVTFVFAFMPIALNGKPEWPALLPAAVVTLSLSLFHSMTVRVTSNDVTVAFGPGLISKSFMIEDITRVSIVRTRWYHGWGIKKIWGGWLYNVSGFDAVQLDMRNGKIYQIGTDEPDKLSAAINEALNTGPLAANRRGEH